MKPSWKDAPTWAKWLAMDVDGQWHWYERKPIKCEDGIWDNDLHTKWENAFIHDEGWKNSLEQRPQEEQCKN